MERSGSVGIKIVVLLASVLLTFWSASSALSMMNAPSNASVGIGVAIIMVLFIVWCFLTPKFFRWFKSISKANTGKLVPVLIACMVLASSPIFTGCTRVGPGHVGIKINMSGDDRGVSDLPLLTGWVWYWPPTQSVFEYPTYVQTAVWTKDATEGSPNNEEVSFNSKEGMIITGDISFSYSLEQEKVPHFYVKFRSDDLNTFTHGFLRNVARDIFNEVSGKYAIDEIYGPKKEEFLKEVRTRIQKEITDIGVKMEQFGFVGAPRPPQNVIDALNAKVAATQLAMQAENELRRETANAQKAVAKAKGEAESNRILTASLTPSLLEWRRLDINEKALVKWNGALSQTVVGSDGGKGLILNLPGMK